MNPLHRKPLRSLVSFFLASLVATVTCVATAQGQTTPGGKLPVFDVVTVKANQSGSNNASTNFRRGALSANNVTLTMLIEKAYGIKPSLISGGPGWMQSERFDLQAKIVDPDPEVVKKMTPEDYGAMLKALLAERFHLKTHIETKTLPIYELVIAKGGAKLVETKDPGVLFHDRSSGSWGTRNTEFTGHDVPLSAMVNFLEYQMQRRVVDKTGLSGRYDILLNWSRDDAPVSAEPSAPSLTTALQEQLGLRLESGKGPVDNLVVDHAEPPTED